MDVHFSMPFIIIMSVLFGMFLTMTLWDLVQIFVELKILKQSDDEDDDDGESL